MSSTSPHRSTSRLPRCVPVAIALAASLLAGCATPAGTQATGSAGSEVVLEGRVVSVDTAPWTYDGNALLVVDGTSRGRITAQLPARWNLCKAQGFDVLQTLKAGDRVRVAGTLTAEGDVSVCGQASHHVRHID
jgi:hypothetical protein